MASPKSPAPIEDTHTWLGRRRMVSLKPLIQGMLLRRWRPKRENDGFVCILAPSGPCISLPLCGFLLLYFYTPLGAFVIVMNNCVP